jgi:hypothetical protein
MCNYRMQWSWSSVFTRRRISFTVHLLLHTHRGHIEWDYVLHKLGLHYRLPYATAIVDLTCNKMEYSRSAKLRNPFHFVYSSVVMHLNILANIPFLKRTPERVSWTNLVFDVRLLGCNTMWTYGLVPTFRRNIMPPFLRPWDGGSMFIFIFTTLWTSNLNFIFGLQIWSWRLCKVGYTFVLKYMRCDKYK